MGGVSRSWLHGDVAEKRAKRSSLGHLKLFEKVFIVCLLNQFACGLAV